MRMTSGRRLLVLVASVLGTTIVGSVLLSRASANAAEPTSIEDVLVESAAYRAAELDVQTAHENIAWAQERLRVNQHLIEQLASGLTQLDAGLPTLTSKIDIATDLVDEASADLVDLAVLQYVLKGTDTESLIASRYPADTAHPARKAFIMDTVMAGHQATLENAQNRRDDAKFAVAATLNGRGDIAKRLETAHIDLAHAQKLLAETSSRLPHLEARIANERRRTRVIGSDLSYVALDAYLLGARAANRDNPGCGLDWTILAGIGRVESRHGTYGGTKLDHHGRVEDPIIGIALNGQFETAIVGDSDAGTLDGDAVFDRAVGPMQFIPTTWAAFSADGNGDGVRDPQNMYDAARSAGNYLCFNGPVNTDETLNQAILRYNASQVYVRAVLLNAARYGELGIST